jgi:hypothetical protein
MRDLAGAEGEHSFIDMARHRRRAGAASLQ